MPLLDDVDLRLQPQNQDVPQDHVPGTIDVFATPAFIAAGDYNELVRSRQVPLFDWANMVWETEVEPPTHFDQQGRVTKSPLLHLYTKTGFLLIGYWPESEPIGRHFMSWAYVDEGLNFDEPTTHH